MPLPGIRAATSFLDELQRDLLETGDQDFDGFFDRWSAAGVPEIEEYRGDRIRSRGEVIAEVGKTRRAIEKRPEILREAETDDSPILTGARRIARGADVLEGLMGNAGNGAPTFTPVSGPAPDATSFATPEFGPATAPEITGIAARARNTTVFGDGFSVNLNDTSSTPEDRAENDAAMDAGAGLSEDEKRNKCEYLQLQIIFWQRQEVTQFNELGQVDKEIETLKMQQKQLGVEIIEHISGVATESTPDDGLDGTGPKKSANKKFWKIAIKIGKKIIGGIVTKLPDLLAIRDKERQIYEIDEKIFALGHKKKGIEYELAATRELIAEATNEFDRVPCEWDLSLGIAG